MIIIFYSIVIFVSIFIAHAQANDAQSSITNKQIHSDESQKSSTFHKLAQLNMQTFSWQEPWWEESSSKSRIEQTLHNLINPCPKRKRHLAFDFFQSIEQHHDALPSVMSNDVETWRDVNLFKGDTDLKTYLASIIDRTVSELGRISLFKLLAHPISDLTTLTQRQQVIAALVDDPDLFNSIKTLLTSLAQSEGVVLAWWDKNYLKKEARRCFFKAWTGKPFNDYALALDGLSVYERSIKAVGCAKAGFASAVLVGYGILQLININPPAELAQQADHYKKAGGWFIKKAWQSNKQLIQGIAALIAGIMCGAKSLNCAKKIRSYSRLENCLHELMTHVAYVVDIMQKLRITIDAHPALSSCQELEDVGLFFDSPEHKNPALQEFISLLCSEELHAEPSILWPHGNALRAYTLINQIKDAVAPALACIGRLDALVSLAQLCQESTDSRTQFSLVTFVHEEKPVLALTDVWCPATNAQNTTPHSITLGGNCSARNAVITGPDRGGKSTVLQEVTFAVIMAQSCGIAPARSMMLTPFHTITTCLSKNYTSDYEPDYHIKPDKLESQDPEEFHFLVFDEALQSGSPIKNSNVSCKLINKLEHQPNSIILMTTHCTQVTKLVEQSKTFKNYKLYAHTSLNEQNKVSYSLEPGISYQDVATIIPQQR